MVALLFAWPVWHTLPLDSIADPDLGFYLVPALKNSSEAGLPYAARPTLSGPARSWPARYGFSLLLLFWHLADHIDLLFCVTG